MNPIYVCFATDDNYVPLASVAIASLLQSNKNVERLEIFLLDSGISNENKEILIKQVNEYRRQIHFIDVSRDLDELKQLGTNAQGTYQSYAAYARFFAINYLPDYVDKLLYVDCDVCICGKLNELFELNLDEWWLGAVIDILPKFHKKAIGFEQTDLYFNSGVLLFNCEKWKKEQILLQIKNHLLTNRCRYSFHDQDIINLVCKGKIYALMPKYMTFLPEYTWNKNGILQLSELNEDAYYTQEEIQDAVINPVIIHYVDCFFGRPWYNGCASKYFKPWNEALKYSPFSEKFPYVDNKTSFAHLILRKIYSILPKKIFIAIHKNRKNKVLWEREKNYEKESNC